MTISIDPSETAEITTPDQAVDYIRALETKFPEASSAELFWALDSRVQKLYRQALRRPPTRESV